MRPFIYIKNILKILEDFTEKPAEPMEYPGLWRKFMASDRILVSKTNGGRVGEIYECNEKLWPPMEFWKVKLLKAELEGYLDEERIIR